MDNILKNEQVISLTEAVIFGSWVVDNWKQTSWGRWQNIYTYEMAETEEELYTKFKNGLKT